MQFEKTPNGNSVLNGDGFFISHVGRGEGFWGSSGFGRYRAGGETALVKAGSPMLILDGDHREKYAAIAEQGYDACKEYYITNISQRSSWSED